MNNPNRCHSDIRMPSPTFETLQSTPNPRFPTPHRRYPCCVGNAHLAARLTNVQITVDVWVGPKLHGQRLRISIAPRLVVDDKAVRESWQQFSARKIMVMDWKAVSAAQAPGGPQHAGRSQWSPQPGGVHMRPLLQLIMTVFGRQVQPSGMHRSDSRRTRSALSTQLAIPSYRRSSSEHRRRGREGRSRTPR